MPKEVDVRAVLWGSRAPGYPRVSSLGQNGAPLSPIRAPPWGLIWVHRCPKAGTNRGTMGPNGAPRWGKPPDKIKGRFCYWGKPLDEVLKRGGSQRGRPQSGGLPPNQGMWESTEYPLQCPLLVPLTVPLTGAPYCAPYGAPYRCPQ